MSFLARLALDGNAQKLARDAREKTLALAEELQAMAFKKSKVHQAPGC
ncbi:MAG: hypothetical protein ACREQF_11575 [Candidatus Binataceae bacterium]